MNQATCVQGYWEVVNQSPHKYWYDILMGFKTELLVAYIVTLVFVLALIVVRYAHLYWLADDATTHEENMMEISNARLSIEKLAIKEEE